MQPPALTARGLVRQFRGFRAVAAHDVELDPRTRHARGGPKGAGKTTLFHLLSAFLPVTAGRIHMGEQDITGLPPERVAQLGIARSFQIISLFPQLSAVDHVALALASRTGLGWRFWRSKRLMRRFDEPARAAPASVWLLAARRLAPHPLPYPPQPPA